MSCGPPANEQHAPQRDEQEATAVPESTAGAASVKPARSASDAERSPGSDVDPVDLHRGTKDARSPSRVSVRQEVLSTRPALDETARRKRLKAMLGAAESRHERGMARRAERPKLTAGLRLQVVRGDRTGHRGTLLDADYINARGLIDLDDEQEPVWVGFDDLRAEPD